MEMQNNAKRARIRFAVILLAVAFLIFFVRMPASGTGYLESDSGAAVQATWWSGFETDSVIANYYFPYPTNLHTTVKMLPDIGTFDSGILLGTGFTIDSIGTNVIEFAVYPKGVGVPIIFTGSHVAKSLSVAADCSGGGPNNLIIFAIDSTTDDTLTNIPVAVFNETGTGEFGGRTGTDGAVTFGLIAGTWIVRTGQNNLAYLFDDTSYVVSLPYDTVAVLGYPNFIPVPTDPDVATVFGDLLNIRGQPVEGIIVTIDLVTRLNVASDNPLFTAAELIATDTSDVAGRFLFPEIVRSMVWSDTLKQFYKITGKQGKKSRFVIDSVLVPDTGNLNVTDVIVAL